MELTVNGKTLGVKFNNYAIEQLANVKGTNRSLYANATAMVWVGYLGWCYVRQIDEELTFEEVSDFVDQANADEQLAPKLVEIIGEYKKSQAYLKLMKKQTEDAKAAPGEGEPEEKKSADLSGTTSTPIIGASAE